MPNRVAGTRKDARQGAEHTKASKERSFLPSLLAILASLREWWLPKIRNIHFIRMPKWLLTGVPEP